MQGKKEYKYITRFDSNGRGYRIPVGIIHGKNEGSQITIFGGQHGTEYDGIQAVHELYRNLDPDKVNGKIAIALVTNEESFNNWQQFAPTPPEVMDMMKELAQGSELLINCHGGELTEGMCPYVICRLLGNEKLDRKAREMADVFGVPYISFSQYRGEPPVSSGGGRPGWWLWPKKGLPDQLQIPEITPEIGERGNRGENGLMYKGIINVLKHFSFLEGKADVEEKPREIGDRYWITAKEKGIFFPSVKVCDDVKKGQYLGVVRDYFGNTLESIHSPATSKVMNMNYGMPVKKDGFLLWLGEIK